MSVDVNLFFWIQGINSPIPVDLGEPLGVDFRLVHAPTPSIQEFLLFYDLDLTTLKWKKSILGKWNNSDRTLDITRFIFPAAIPLGQGWRNSLVTWNLNSPVSTNTCYEQYKFNKGANFNGADLYLIDLSQQVAGKPVSEAIFDSDFTTGTIQIKKYTPTPNSTTDSCALGSEQLINATIPTLKVVPEGESIEDFEFELLSVNYFT